MVVGVQYADMQIKITWFEFIYLFNTVKLQTVKQVATKAKFLLLRAHASESRHFFQKFLNQSQIFRNKCQDERID